MRAQTVQLRLATRRLSFLWTHRGDRRVFLEYGEGLPVSRQHVLLFLRSSISMAAPRWYSGPRNTMQHGSRDILDSGLRGSGEESAWWMRHVRGMMRWCHVHRRHVLRLIHAGQVECMQGGDGAPGKAEWGLGTVPRSGWRPGERAPRAAMIFSRVHGNWYSHDMSD